MKLTPATIHVGVYSKDLDSTAPSMNPMTSDIFVSSGWKDTSAPALLKRVE